MKKILGPIAALSIMLGAATAFGEEANGTIQTIDTDEQQVTLSNGMRFSLSEGVSTGSLQPGDEVKVTYEEREGEKIATQISKPE